MNIVISDPKTGKAFGKKSEEVVFAGKKIGEEVDLGAIGLQGYSGKITGGSDSDGFPMKGSLEGSIRRKILIGKGTGFKSKTKGERKRRTVRGNTISKGIAQLNIAITKHGSAKLEDLLGKEKSGSEGEAKEAGKEKKKEEKEGAGEAEKPAGKKGEKPAGESEEKPAEKAGKKKEEGKEAKEEKKESKESADKAEKTAGETGEKGEK